jgi:hypothetical protein
VCFIKMHRTDHTARAETLYLLCAAPIAVPARVRYQPSRSCRLDSVARSAKGRPSLQMQPDDYDRHRLVTGRNVLGVYLVGTLVAEDSAQRQPYNGPQDSSASAARSAIRGLRSAADAGCRMPCRQLSPAT